jgi:hypothetical protein
MPIGLAWPGMARARAKHGPMVVRPARHVVPPRLCRRGLRAWPLAQALPCGPIFGPCRPFEHGTSSVPGQPVAHHRARELREAEAVAALDAESDEKRRGWRGFSGPRGIRSSRRQRPVGRSSSTLRSHPRCGLTWGPPAPAGPLPPALAFRVLHRGEGVVGKE